MPSEHTTDSRLQSPRQGRNPMPQTRRVDSRTLMGSDHLLMIEHAGSSYYLRMTRNNKLILTK
ncbi:hemin uptake protein HemP [Thiobaca trueperi]|uniref:Hemin uptake protein HemP n=1 Tax=Thiobaca trueperi TaxID=127458 RepID=A0A4R3N478_9GAMM|nr:hemin uptake protein HemP [Thiobaca trueperi]TCT21519.1 hemin uptake protein HemP [Thiobaca trueperi]